MTAYSLIFLLQDFWEPWHSTAAVRCLEWPWLVKIWFYSFLLIHTGKKNSESLLKSHIMYWLILRQYTVVASNFIWLRILLYHRIKSPEQTANLEGQSKKTKKGILDLRCTFESSQELTVTFARTCLHEVFPFAYTGVHFSVSITAMIKSL